MRPDQRFAQLRLARRAALAALILTVVALLASFLVRRSPRPAAERPALLEEAKVSRSEGVEHTEFKSGRGVFHIKSPRTFAGEDGLNHLEGGVEVVYSGRTGSLEVVFGADRAAYDRELRNFVLEGNARVRHKDLVLESPAFAYDNDRDLFHTDRGVSVSGRLNGAARAAVYREASGELELSGDVRLEFRSSQDTGPPLELRTDRLVYRRPGKTGEVEGSLILLRGESWAQGATGAFVLSEDEQRLKSVTLRGEVNASLVPDGAGGRPRTVRCGELVLAFYEDSNTLQYAEATKSCDLRFEDENGRPVAIDAGERAILYFSPEGGLKDFDTRGDARIVLEAGEAVGRRECRADRILYHRAGKTLRLIGREGAPAAFDVADTSVEGADIRAGLKSENIQAAGAVRVVLKSSPQGAGVGFFSRQQPIVIVCEEMRYLKARKRFYFKNGVRIWQEKESLSAAEVEIVEDTTEVFARGGVQSLFSRRPKDEATEERIAVGAEAMNYFPGDRRVVYEGRATMGVKDLSLEAETVTVSLKRDGGDIESVLAKRRVVVRQGTREARGGEARYILAEETMVLTDQPVLVDKERGTVEGDKLIFHLGDGRIQVENADRERSVIIIRS